jgi:hypothetical protein
LQLGKALKRRIVCSFPKTVSKPPEYETIEIKVVSKTTLFETLSVKEMQEWKSKALEVLPEIKTEILNSDNPGQLWIEIVDYFDEAYKEPRNESFIKRVYEYQNWCLEQKQDEPSTEDDLMSCVATVFWEHLPTTTEARADMPRWFTLEDVLANQNFFSYHLTAENFNYLIDLFPKQFE